MLIINISRVFKSSSSSENYSSEYILPINLVFDKIYVLGPRYSDVQVEIDPVTRVVNFNLFMADDYLQRNFEEMVADLNFKILFFEKEKYNYEEIIDFIVEDHFDSNLEAIKKLLKTQVIIKDGEQFFLPEESLSTITGNLNEDEKEDLRLIVSVGLIKGFSDYFGEKKTVSIHTKGYIEYDEVNTNKLYCIAHDAPIQYEMVLMYDLDPYTIVSSQLIITLQHYENFKLDPIEGIDPSQYMHLYKAIKEFNINYFELLEEYSSIGGNINFGFSQHDIEDGNSHVNDWAQLAILNGFAHGCDFLENFGDCLVHFLINKNSQNKREVKIMGFLENS